METECKRNHPLMSLLLLLLELGSCFTVGAASQQLIECNGSMAECVDIGEEFSVDSEVSERVLQTIRRHIAPGVLKADTPACKVSDGMPYTGNCLPDPSNPRWTRGCSKIYRCRPGT